jgi:TonB dependent receptor
VRASWATTVLVLASALAHADDAPPVATSPTTTAPVATTPAAPRIYQSNVRAARVERAGVVETAVSGEEARHVAGTADDPLKVIEDLPGVARAAVGTGAIIVWGAAPNDTRVLIDGVEVPALFHVGGWRSIVNGDLVGRVALAPGGWGADWGRGLGGLVRVETAGPPAAGLHGDVAVDLLDGSARLSYSAGRFSVTIAGRYGWLDHLAGAVVSPDVQAFVPLPRYDDYQLKATARLRPSETLSLLFLGADDALRRSVFAGDPTQARSDSLDRSMWRLALRYVSDRDGAHVEVTPFVGFDRNHTAEQFGPTPANLAVDGWNLGLRASYRRSVARRLVLTFGIDLLDTHSDVARSGSLTIPPREGDPYVFGQPPGSDVASDRFSVHQLDAAPYVAGELRLGPLTVTPGLRFDALLLQGDHLTPPVAAAPPTGFTHLSASLDPRLALRWRVHPRLALTAAAGLYHQPPDAVDLGARFGNPKLGASRALHVTLGGELHIAAGLSAEVDGFYRQLDGLATRNLSPAPPVGQSLVAEGIGRSYGGQLLLRQAPWRGLSGWISYTLSRSERRDHPSTAWRLFDGDQTHVLTLVGNYRFRHWDFGLRFRYSTGFPRTPVVGAYWNAAADRYDPLFGAINATRIPDFIQLDLRAEYAFVWTRWTLRIYLDAQNVTWQRNPEEIVYNESYTQRGYITGLPTLAVLGARVQF